MGVMFRKEFYATVICDNYCSDDDIIVRVALECALFTGYDKSDMDFYGGAK